MKPKLRFKEFSGDWESKRLGDTLKIKHGKDQKSIQEENGVYPILGTSGEIGRTNTPLYNKESVLIGRKGTINRPFYMNKPFWTVDTLFYSEIKKNMYPKFIYYKFQNINWIRYCEASGVPSLSASTIENIKYSIPSLKEQEKIASFLSLVDERINLQNKKVEALKEYKKGVMQKIFKKELRFKYDNGNDYPKWEEKKLGDISDIRTGGNDLQDKVENGKYPFFVRSKNVERIDNYTFDGEAILIPGDGNIGQIYHYINGKFAYHQRVYKISDFKNIVIGKYIYYYLIKFFLKEALKNSVKATVDSLRLPTLTNMNINLPCLDEQIKISSFLSLIDEKIEKETKKLNLLNDYKKGLLQKMFV